VELRYENHCRVRQSFTERDSYLYVRKCGPRIETQQRQDERQLDKQDAQLREMQKELATPAFARGVPYLRPHAHDADPWLAVEDPAAAVRELQEEDVLLAALLHVFVALKRTWDISINYTIASGKLNLAISGITLLTFMTIHLFQFRFGETQPFALCPPPYLINFKTLLELRLNLFWVHDEGCHQENVRDIYRMEFEVFQSLGWCLFYIASVVIFCTHTCLGWNKVVPAPALEIPKRYHSKAIHVGYAMTAFVALIYISFPLYTHLFAMSPGNISPEAPLA